MILSCSTRSLEPKKRKALKSDDRSSQKWPAKVHSSIASLHKNGFGLTNLQHKPDLNVPFSWPQEVLVYIYLKLVTISQLPLRSGLKKVPISPNIGKKSPKMSNLGQNYSKKIYFVAKIKTSPFGLGAHTLYMVIWLNMAKRQPRRGCALALTP
jgi:hypothetical protein